MDTSLPQNRVNNQPTIGITMGDAAGIGPEIIVKALSDPLLRRAANYVIFGMHEQMCYAADRAELEPFWGRHPHEKLSRTYPHKVMLAEYDEFAVPSWVGEASRAAGESSIRFCLDAISAAQDGLIDAIVTGPINKTSWKMANGEWPGHTEMLRSRTKSRRCAMMFVSGPLKLALATIHMALFDVRHAFTIGRVFEPIDLLDQALRDYFGIENPKIGVAALNPHAGENGQFGDEEQRIIAPAILLAQEQGINCDGPHSADTLFLRTVNGDFDAAVAMYHDQAMIPIKLVDPKNAVNVTIGTPLIRTSPAHGTAYDIAGKNMADASSMKSAIRCAIQMTRVRQGMPLTLTS